MRTGGRRPFGRALLRLLLGGVLLAAPVDALAEEVAYGFTAVVTEVQGPGPLPEGLPARGDIVRGRFRYESDATGTTTSDTASFRLFRPANGFQLELPSNLDFVGAPITIGLSRDYKGEPLRGAHLLRIGSEMRGKAMGWPFEVARVSADLVLWNETRTVATNLELPTRLDLADFVRAEFVLIGSWGPQDPDRTGPLWAIRGRIDSLTPIEAADAVPASDPSPAPEASAHP